MNHQSKYCKEYQLKIRHNANRLYRRLVRKYIQQSGSLDPLHWNCIWFGIIYYFNYTLKLNISLREIRKHYFKTHSHRTRMEKYQTRALKKVIK